MSLSRLFAVVAVIGLIAAAVLTIRSAATTSAAAENAGERYGKMTDRALEQLGRQEVAGDSTVASTSERYGKMTERALEQLGRQGLAGGSVAVGAAAK